MYVKETHRICQGNSSYMSKNASYISRKHIIYVEKTHHMCQGNTSDMSGKPIVYIKDTHQIFKPTHQI